MSSGSSSTASRLPPDDRGLAGAVGLVLTFRPGALDDAGRLDDPDARQDAGCAAGLVTVMGVALAAGLSAN